MKRQKQCSSEQDKKCPLFLSTPFSLTIPQSLSLTVKSHGLLLYSTLSMENFISQTAKSLYYHLRRISSVLKYLSTEATVKLVTSFTSVPPRLLQFSPFWPACFLCPKPSSHTELCCSPHTEKHTRKTHRSHLCFNFSTGSQSSKEVSTR